MIFKYPLLSTRENWLIYTKIISWGLLFYGLIKRILLTKKEGLFFFG